MEYKVLARKCRPQTFDEVVGQQHVTRTLKNAIREQRIAHAFLFTGERGVGKTSVARILAKALNCQNGPTDQPCGTCASCSEIAAGTTVDVHEIDGASYTGVDDIRTLRENAQYLPSRDRYKIYIIDEVHMLSTSAFNALLKTLEEPPRHIVFVFATTEPHKIPDTIISRCLRFDFKRIPIKQIAAHLDAIVQREGVQISPRGLFLIAREADGSMRDAQTLLERAIAYCEGRVEDADLEELLGHIDRRIVYRIIEASVTDDPRGCLEQLQSLYNLGTDLRRFYYVFLELLRDLLMVKVAPDTAQLVEGADEDLRQLKELSGRLPLETLQRSFRVWFAAEEEIVKSSMPKIALEMCLLEMVSLQKAIPLEEIVSRIDELSLHLEKPQSRPRPVQTSERHHAAPETAEVKGPPPATDGNADGFLAFLRMNNPPLASILSQSTLRFQNDGTLAIGLPPGSFFMDRVRDPETQKKIRAAAKEFMQHDVGVAVIETQKKKKEVRRDGILAAKRTAEQEALHNPVIQKLLEAVDGTIVEIRTNL